MTATEMLIDHIFSSVHLLRIETVPDGSQMSYAVICSCGRWESGDYVTRESAEARLAMPCDIAAIEERSARRKADRLARQAAQAEHERRHSRGRRDKWTRV